jgi:hypothetical protein
MIEKIIAEVELNGNTFAYLTEEQKQELRERGYTIEDYAGCESLIYKNK